MKIHFMNPAAKQLQELNNKNLLTFYRTRHTELLEENALLRQRLADYEDLAKRAGLMSQSQEAAINNLLTDMGFPVEGGDAA